MTRSEILDEQDTIALGINEDELLEAEVEPELDLDGMDVNDVIAMTARLANIMAQEADMLEEMRVGDIAGLHQEKLLLTHALNAARKHVMKHPHIMEEATDEEREDLASIIEVFDEIKRENHTRLLMAKSVNERIVQAITDTVKEQRSKGTYTKKGNTAQPTVGNMAVSLNESV